VPTYLFIGHDQPPHAMALRDAIRAEHRAYVLEQDAMIRFACALTDGRGHQCGSIIAFEADNPDRVHDWLRHEPFNRAGVYARVEVVECLLALNRYDRMEWPVPHPAAKPRT
jgi:uncharacterized protein